MAVPMRTLEQNWGFFFFFSFASSALTGVILFKFWGTEYLDYHWRFIL